MNTKGKPLEEEETLLKIRDRNITRGGRIEVLSSMTMREPMQNLTRLASKSHC